MTQKVALINLGCPKNLVDSEVMLGHLQAEGFEITGSAEGADVVVVNTCGFLQDAARESIDHLQRAGDRKRRGRLKAVVAAGCMTQRYGDDCLEALPHVDGFLGVGQASHLPDVIRTVLRGERVSRLNGPAAGFEGYGLRIQSTPTHSAYIKVSEGCDRHCSFCVIPSIRGEMVSRPVDQIVREAEVLAAQGVREVILVGQDPTRYGVDLPDGSGSTMPELLRRLNDIQSLRWIRVMYLFPDRHVEAILRAMTELPKVCPYVDMPFQHAATTVLRRMNRPGGAAAYHDLLRRLREWSPEITLRSTFIVGFPGETDEEFGELLRFVREAELDWVGAFRYSPEDGAPSAEMPGRVKKRTVAERYETLMSVQQSITATRLARWVGREIEVLVERLDGGVAVGRASFQAPDVDGETVVRPGALDVRPGDFVRARVTGSGDYDLEADALEVAHRTPMRAPGLLHIGVMNQGPTAHGR